MDFTLKIEGLDALIAAFPRGIADVAPLIHKEVVAGILRVNETARLNAPHRTGTLQRSIHPEYSELQGEVKVGEKYGLWIEEGTDPFEIRPRNKQALMWPGAAHPVRVVHHPGLKARPFFQPSIDESRAFIESQFVVVVNTLANILAAKGVTHVG